MNHDLSFDRIILLIHSSMITLEFVNDLIDFGGKPSEDIGASSVRRDAIWWGFLLRGMVVQVFCRIILKRCCMNAPSFSLHPVLKSSRRLEVPGKVGSLQLAEGWGKGGGFEGVGFQASVIRLLCFSDVFRVMILIVCLLCLCFVAIVMLRFGWGDDLFWLLELWLDVTTWWGFVLQQVILGALDVEGRHLKSNEAQEPISKRKCRHSPSRWKRLWWWVRPSW